MPTIEANCTLLEEAGEFYGRPRARMSDWGQFGFTLLGRPIVTTLNISARYRITVEEDEAGDVLCRKKDGDYLADYRCELDFLSATGSNSLLHVNGEPFESMFVPGRRYRVTFEKSWPEPLAPRPAG